MRLSLGRSRRFVCAPDPDITLSSSEEGAIVSCPARVVHRERIPAIDILIVSHRHPDHFDIASLDCLPRDCDAICPTDPLIVYGLRRLGFTRIHPVDAMGEISSVDFELFPTLSAYFWHTKQGAHGAMHGSNAPAADLPRRARSAAKASNAKGEALNAPPR